MRANFFIQRGYKRKGISSVLVQFGKMKSPRGRTEFQTRLTQFFSDCRTRKVSTLNVEKMCFPIYWSFLKQEFGTFVKLLFAVVSMTLLIFFVPFLNWTFSAIARLILIEVLPYWKWTNLYNQRCLWDFEEPPAVSINDPLDCSVCENLSKKLKMYRHFC